MKFTATIAIAITMGVAPVFAQPVRGFEVSTLDDPGAYTKPWNGGFNLRWNPGAEMFE